MASRLTPCPGCQRHVKLGPPVCPFCGVEVPVHVPARAAPAGRPLSRAAIVFASAAVVTACSSSTTPPETKDAEVDTGHAVAAYGVAIHEDAGADAGVVVHDAGFHDDVGQSTADYGVFVNPDGG
jgi:hypothetical protein